MPAPSSPAPQRLTGKVCIVTGAARGIGRAIAMRFHDEGGVVVVTDIDETTGAATAADIGCRFLSLDGVRRPTGDGSPARSRPRTWWSTTPA